MKNNNGNYKNEKRTPVFGNRLAYRNVIKPIAGKLIGGV